MNGPRFVAALRSCGYDFFTGVPCSLLKSALSELEKTPDYLSAVREDSAVGIAAGAFLGGRKSAVFLQNSGLGVCLNALASLSAMYEFPCLLVVSWRGRGPDAPEHVLTGRITPSLLELLEIPTVILETERMEEQVREADRRARERSRPSAILVPEGILNG